MKKILKRIRGIIGTGITWALGWTGVLSALHFIMGAPLQYIGQTIITGLIWGFVAGGSFAVVLSIAERRHALAELRLWRVGLWGGIGGSILILITVLIMGVLGNPTSGVLGALALNFLIGAGFASGSVALAKRADNRLLEVDEAELLMGEE